VKVFGLYLGMQGFLWCRALRQYSFRRFFQKPEAGQPCPFGVAQGVRVRLAALSQILWVVSPPETCINGCTRLG
jgi:hypothetical protein